MGQGKGARRTIIHLIETGDLLLWMSLTLTRTYLNKISETTFFFFFSLGECLIICLRREYIITLLGRDGNVKATWTAPKTSKRRWATITQTGKGKRVSANSNLHENADHGALLMGTFQEEIFAVGKFFDRGFWIIIIWGIRNMQRLKMVFQISSVISIRDHSSWSLKFSTWRINTFKIRWCSFPSVLFILKTYCICRKSALK